MSVSHDARPARSSVFDDERYSSLEPNRFRSLLLSQCITLVRNTVVRATIKVNPGFGGAVAP